MGDRKPDRFFSLRGARLLRRKRARPKGLVQRRWFTAKWLLWVLLTTSFMIMGGYATILFSARMMPLEGIEAQNMPVSSQLLDRYGKSFGSLSGEQREVLALSVMQRTNPYLLRMLERVEDRRFREHQGVDLHGVARATWRNLRSFERQEGAGTITMQTCRNVVLQNRSRDFSRKFKEALCALALENRYSKDRILEAYANQISFGYEIVGIAQAAKLYFGVDLAYQTLSLEQAAMLVGMPKAPNQYNPVRHPDQALARRNLVLDLLAQQEDAAEPPLLSVAQAEALKRKPLGVEAGFAQRLAASRSYEAFKYLVREEIRERYGLEEAQLEGAGYQVHTSLDPQAQRAVEESLQDTSLFRNAQQKPLRDVDASALLLEPQTGQVLAVGGGRHFRRGSVNRALERIQPGSAIKPLTVFTPAVQEHGYNEYSMVPDYPIRVGEWEPKNFDGKRRDAELPLQEVVARSLNLPTVWLLKEIVGLETAIGYGRQLGLPLLAADRDYAPLALGGLNEGVNTRELAQAYAVYPNHGKYLPAHAVVEVRDAQNREVKPRIPLPAAIPVFEPRAAYYTTRMLESAVRYGTAHHVRLRDQQPVAGKTGTTQNGEAAWFVGFTPNRVLVVNLFYPNRKVTMGSLRSELPARVFSRIMDHLPNAVPVAFSPPPGVLPPAPPLQLTAPVLQSFATQDWIMLQWSAQPERVAFEIYRALPGKPFQRVAYLGPGATSYHDFLSRARATVGQQVYVYRVAAVDLLEPKSPRKFSRDHWVTLPARSTSQGLVPPGDSFPEWPTVASESTR